MRFVVVLTLLATTPARAGVVGDIVAGLGLDESEWDRRLGARVGFATERVAFLAGVDYNDAGDEPGQDTPADERRVRMLGLVAVPLALSYDSTLDLHAGGGAEIERSRTLLSGTERTNSS